MSKNFCLRVKIRHGALLVFLKVSGTKIYSKLGYHAFSSKNFSLTAPKNFVGEPFCVPKSFWHRETVHKRWYHDFSVDFFSQYRKILQKGFFRVCEYLLVLGKDFNCRPSKMKPVKPNRGKSRNFVLTLEIIIM